MSEILAPAGDKNSALAAINTGADAIYLGLKKFSARSSAENFGLDELRELINYAHAFGVNVYVAMNTLIKEGECEDFLSEALEVWNCGADALIISDIFLGEFIKSNYPQITLHLSTQAGVCNAYGAALAKEKGFSRVVLARETSLEDIKSIAKIIETEVFIQGALCTCFSGQCYFSSFAGGNSGNRGKCKQPCRKLYSIDRAGFEEPSYKISLSDLSVGEDIKTLLEAGVFSFKIEGRMRRPEYVAAAVNYYKKILQSSAKTEDLSALKRTYNRGNYTKGLAFGQRDDFISSAIQGHIGEFAGVIKVENGKFICLTDKKFARGCGFKILRAGKEIGGATATGENKSGIILNSSVRLKNGDKAFITTDILLNERLLTQKRLIKLTVNAEFFAGKPAKISINGKEFHGDAILQKAENKPLTEEAFKSCFYKTDKFPYEVNIESFATDGVFIALSELNALRRNAFSEYFNILSQNSNEKYEKNHTIPKVAKGNDNLTAVIATDLNGVTADIGILKPDDYFSIDRKLFGQFKGEKFLYLPPFLTGKEIKKILPVAEPFDGIYCDGLYAVKLCEKINKPLFAGTGLNLSNSAGVTLCKAKYIALSKELTLAEAADLSAQNTFYLTAGNIKLMDLIYCPFGKKCASCDKRQTYTLTDNEGRNFPLRRYKTENCRFEVFNCADLVADTPNCGTLLDCTLQKDPEKILKAVKNGEKPNEIFKNYTRGHSVQPIK